MASLCNEALFKGAKAVAISLVVFLVAPTVAAGSRAEFSAEFLDKHPIACNRLVDEVGILDVSDRRLIEERLYLLECWRGAQAAVVIVKTTRGEPIERFAWEVASKWRLGRVDVDDGLLFVIASEDRRFRIEVGRGLEAALTDAWLDKMIVKYASDRLKAGDPAAAIIGVISRVEKRISGLGKARCGVKNGRKVEPKSGS